MGNIEKAELKYISKYINKPEVVVNVSYISSTKEVLTLFDTRVISSDCYLIIDADQLFIYSYGILSSKVKEEFKLSELFNMKLYRSLDAKKFSFETQDRICKVTNLKKGDFELFFNLLSSKCLSEIAGIEKL